MSPDEALSRLFRAAQGSALPPAEMPFGFDTRVLALVRQPRGTELISAVIRRTTIVAAGILAAALVGVLHDSLANGSLPSEYTIADRVIENGLTE